jgi:hypothetical protein
MSSAFPLSCRTNFFPVINAIFMAFQFREFTVADTEQPDSTAMTVQLLSAYFSNNQVPAGDIAGIIEATRDALERKPRQRRLQRPNMFRLCRSAKAWVRVSTSSACSMASRTRR